MNFIDNDFKLVYSYILYILQIVEFSFNQYNKKLLKGDLHDSLGKSATR